MEFKNDSLLLSDTAVPDLFIYYHLRNLSKEAIALYLCILSTGDKARSEADLNEISFFDSSVTKEAIAELIAAGLLARNSKGKFSLVDIKKQEVDSYCASVIAKGGANLSDLELSPMQKERDNLCDSISKTVYAGKMGYVFYRIVDKCLFDYGFETIVIYTLFDVAKDRMIQYNYREVEKLAEQWQKKGIRTADMLNSYLEAESKRKDLIAFVGKVTRKHLDGYDIDRIDKWISLGFSADLIAFAFECNNYRELKTMYIDETLAKWMAAGISDLEAAKVYEKEQHKENKRKYSKRKNKQDNSYYRTGEEAGLADDISTTSSPAPATDATDAGSEGDNDSFKDILNMFGDGNDEDD